MIKKITNSGSPISIDARQPLAHLYLGISVFCFLLEMCLLMSKWLAWTGQNKNKSPSQQKRFTISA